MKRAMTVNYEKIFESMNEGFALFQSISHEQKGTVDARFVAVNPAF